MSAWQQLFEGYHEGSIYSRNSGNLLQVDFGPPTMMLLYPKNWTPICTAELYELAEHMAGFEGMQVLAGSTDSPEGHERFFGELGHLPYPVLTIAPKHEELWQFVDKDGYPARVAIFLRDGQVRTTYQVPVDQRRELKRLLNIAQVIK